MINLIMAVLFVIGLVMIFRVTKKPPPGETQVPLVDMAILFAAFIGMLLCALYQMNESIKSLDAIEKDLIEYGQALQDVADKADELQ